MLDTDTEVEDAVEEGEFGESDEDERAEEVKEEEAVLVEGVGSAVVTEEELSRDVAVADEADVCEAMGS